MEESLSLLEAIKKQFHCKEVDVRAYSPLTLAYIGDAIYDLIIRTVVVERANMPANLLHKTSIRYVNAKVQSLMIQKMIEAETLTEEEQDVYKRGRNAKSYTTAKNASVADYRKATGFEALLGFLYLNGKTDRIMELVEKGLELAEMKL